MQLHRLVVVLSASILLTLSVIAAPVSATNSQPPAPAALVGVELTGSDFALSWAQPVDVGLDDPLLTFRVYRSSDGVSFALIAETASTYYVDSEYVDGQVAAYAVTAFSDDGGESDPAVLEVLQHSGTCVKMNRFTIAIYVRSCIGHG